MLYKKWFSFSTNHLQRTILYIQKIMMVNVYDNDSVKANNDGYNITLLFVGQGFFRVSVLFLGVSWVTSVWWAVFITLQATVFPAVSKQYFFVGAFMRISYLRVAVFQGIFQWLFLTFISHYNDMIIYFCLVFVYTFGVFTITTYVHYYSVHFCFP